MVQPILILNSATDLSGPVVGDVLVCEGYPWFSELPVALFTESPPAVRLIVVTGDDVGHQAARRLARAVAAGAALIAVSPQPALAGALGITVGELIADAQVVVKELAGWQHGEIPLLCPDRTTRLLTGGRVVASLEAEAGAAVVHTPFGRGQAWLYGYDLARVIVTLRHGNGQLDERPAHDMGPLVGPRHLYSFYELSKKLPRDVPVADLHQDLFRQLVAQVLSHEALPRLWHFPAGAPALWFIKGDGCGEFGVDQLVEVAERQGGLVSFYRAPESRYAGDLMREWRNRGHGISIEADINDLTQINEVREGKVVRYGRSAAEVNAERLPEIRARLKEQRDRFQAETGLDTDTVCIHSCQWSGLPMAQMVLELGWHTPTHFISHDPRMRYDDRYGPYMIPSALPLPYYDPTGGRLDLWHMPAQWDESQTLGQYDQLVESKPSGWPGWQAVPAAYHPFYAALAPDRARGMIGLTPEAYGDELAQFALAAAAHWHGIQICNFHPLYVAGPQDHPRASRLALEIGMEGARAAGCRFANLEDWSQFFRARASVKLQARHVEGATTTLELRSAQEVRELTLLLPEVVRQVHNAQTGHAFELHSWELEGRTQQGIVVDLPAGQTLSLRLTE